MLLSRVYDPASLLRATPARTINPSVIATETLATNARRGRCNGNALPKCLKKRGILRIIHRPLLAHRLSLSEENRNRSIDSVCVSLAVACPSTGAVPLTIVFTSPNVV